MDEDGSDVRTGSGELDLDVGESCGLQESIDDLLSPINLLCES